MDGDSSCHVKWPSDQSRSPTGSDHQGQGTKRQVTRDQPTSSSWSGIEDIAKALSEEFDISLSGFGNQHDTYDFSNLQNTLHCLPASPIQRNQADHNQASPQQSNQVYSPNDNHDQQGWTSPTSGSIDYSPKRQFDSAEQSPAYGQQANQSPLYNQPAAQSPDSFKKNCTQDYSQRSPTSWYVDNGLNPSSEGSPEPSSERSPPQDPNWTYSAILAPSVQANNFNVTGIQPGQSMKMEMPGSTRAFHYTLGAPTAIGSKLGCNSMTYLNQSQSYEIRLKRINDINGYGGNMVRSSIRLSFTDRRLQFREREEVTHWQQNHPRDRMMDVDLPLSYGIFEIQSDPELTNWTEFTWDTLREASVFVRINCISTEFTSKRHGGERGVPLKFVVETVTTDAEKRRLNVAMCQMKVFKSKGADRKHKTDREKFEKYNDGNKKTYSPAYECTVFTDVDADHVELDDDWDQLPGTTDQRPVKYGTPVPSPPQIQPASSSVRRNGPEASHSPHQPTSEPGTPARSDNESVDSSQEPPSFREALRKDSALTTSSSSGGLEDLDEVKSWLHRHRFEKLLPTFLDYKYAEMTKLSKGDMIDMCGMQDGVRLYNALHREMCKPVLILYVAIDTTGFKDVLSALDDEPLKAFNAIYLERKSVEELSLKLSELFTSNSNRGLELFVIGPGGIRIRCTDRFIDNMTNESAFTCQFSDGKL
ncbi:Transcription factor CP2 [Halotydeus destructor]|nr:Transcription factor CP2 [Halotydeus destructor]